MPSAESDALRAHYQTITDRLAENPSMGLPAMRSIFEELAGLSREPEGVSYAEVDVDGVRGLWCLPDGAPDDRVIVYTHGGGFMGNTADSHRKLAGHLARAAGVRALSVDYRLAPENPFPAQIDDAVTVHSWLRRTGFPAAGTVTAGDSAGGNLAVTSVLRLRDRGEELPAGVVAFSPWVDMENTGETLAGNADKDALVSMGVVTMMSQSYLGADGAATDPLATPLYADFAGFPPLFVSAGSDETLLADAQRLADRAAAAGVGVDFSIADRQQHVYPFMAGRAPEADATIAAAGAWIRARLGLQA